MAHRRETLLQALEAVLRGAPYGLTVYRARPYAAAIQDGECPCVVLRQGPSRHAYHDANTKVFNDLTVILELWEKATAPTTQGTLKNSDVEARLNALDVTVSKAIESVNGGQLASEDIVLRQLETAPRFTAEGEVIEGVLVKTVEIRHRTSRTDPEST